MLRIVAHGLVYGITLLARPSPSMATEPESVRSEVSASAAADLPQADASLPTAELTTPVTPTPIVVHSVGAALGAMDLHERDEYLTPFVRRGWLFAAAASYERATGRSTQDVRLAFSTGGLDSSTHAAGGNVYLGRIAYAYRGAVAGWNVGGNPITVLLGGGLSTFLSYDTVPVVPNTNWYGADRTWYWSHAIDLHAGVDYSMPQQSVALRLTTPAIRLVARPTTGHHFSPRNDSVQDDSFIKAAAGGELEAPWSSPVLGMEIETRRQLTTDLALTATFTFSFFSSETPLAMRSYANNLVVGVQWSPL